MVSVNIADKAETHELLSIYTEKVKWLRAVNKPLWDESQFTLDAMCSLYGDPVYYVGYVDAKILGGFILLDCDRLYWPEKADDPAFYFHKFVIRNEYCGKGYADEMIQWVKGYGKERNKRYIRLDYDGNRSAIADLYTRNGFIPMETIRNEHTSILVKAEFVIV
jgi:GNAT superfamily N-acetyltransferase